MVVNHATGVQFPDEPLSEMARSSSGQDAWFSTRKWGFDSPTGHSGR